MENPSTSQSLLELARDCSDGAAWRRLTERYVPLIRRWLRPYLLQPADADDLVQEVLATHSREIPGFDLGTGA
jgi:DNA-directed RNA polymerase specialized sigma24 family protein